MSLCDCECDFPLLLLDFLLFVAPIPCFLFMFALDFEGQQRGKPLLLSGAPRCFAKRL